MQGCCSYCYALNDPLPVEDDNCEAGAMQQLGSMFVCAYMYQLSQGRVALEAVHAPFVPKRVLLVL